MQPRLYPAVVLMLALAGQPATWAARQPALEYDVKAAFLLNFARYVTWPAPQHATPFGVCLLGHNPFGDRLESVVAGETWQGAPIRVRTIQEVREARGCHLLYVPAAATDRFLASAGQVAKRPVLTVGETPEFLRRGGMIRLFLDGNKVRFSVNQAAADAAGLTISSRLLRLAREVVGDASAFPNAAAALETTGEAP